MNVYRLSIGYMAHYVAATSEDDARAQGSDSSRFPGMSFLPFNIELVEVSGYTIQISNGDDLPFTDLSTEHVIEPDEDEFDDLVPDMELVRDQVANMGRDQLVSWLKENDIKHHHNLGDDKLRELIINHVE